MLHRLNFSRVDAVPRTFHFKCPNVSEWGTHFAILNSHLQTFYSFLNLAPIRGPKVMALLIRMLALSSASIGDTVTVTINDQATLGKSMPDSVTGLMYCSSGGDRKAFDHLVALVYRELHAIAERHLRRELSHHTLQPTALIHEAYLKLVNYGGVNYENRNHFLAVAARAMRQILMDHAKARNASKRGAAVKTSLQEDIDVALPGRGRIMTALDDALNTLAKQNWKRARLVELRFFAGMTAENIAEYVAMPVHKVRRELLIAQAWLRHQIEA